MNAPRICLSLFGTTDEICGWLRTYDADLFEIRLDLSDKLDGKRIRTSTSRPLLFAAHGRPDLLEQYWPFADYIDVETGEASGQNLIVSIHTSGQDPDLLWEQLSGDHITKLVLQTDNYDQIAKLIDLNKKHSPRAICFAAGEIGAFSRLISAIKGGRWIYSCLPGRNTGDGQFIFEELMETYRIRRLDRTNLVSVFGIVGEPVAHSRSPEFHNRRFAEEELPWIYVPYPCKDLRSLLHHAPEWGGQGFSITHPYKMEILPLLDSITSEASMLQSCNTVAYVEGKWYGTNTDMDGVRRMLQEVLSVLCGE